MFVIAIKSEILCHREAWWNSQKAKATWIDSEIKCSGRMKLFCGYSSHVGVVQSLSDTEVTNSTKKFVESGETWKMNSTLPLERKFFYWIRSSFTSHRKTTDFMSTWKNVSNRTLVSPPVLWSDTRTSFRWCVRSLTYGKIHTRGIVLALWVLFCYGDALLKWF